MLVSWDPAYLQSPRLTELLCARRVHDFQNHLPPVYVESFRVRVLYGGIISLDEDALHKLRYPSVSALSNGVVHSAKPTCNRALANPPGSKHSYVVHPAKMLFPDGLVAHFLKHDTFAFLPSWNPLALTLPNFSAEASPARMRFTALLKGVVLPLFDALAGQFCKIRNFLNRRSGLGKAVWCWSRLGTSWKTAS